MKKSLIITVGTGVGKNEEATRSIAHGIVASIENSHPDFIVFFTTNESEERTIPEIKRLLPDLQQNKSISIKDMNDVNEVFEKISKEIQNLKRDGYKVVVDFTSGTKAMSAGAVLAATSKVTKLSYVAGERVEGKVVTGSENVMTYSPVKGIIDMQEKIIKELFDSYLFGACNRIIDKLLDLTSEPTTVARLSRYKTIIDGYTSWDRFHHDKSKELLSKLDNIPPKNKEFLGRLSGSEGKEPFHIADLLNNAIRRSKEGKYDDAVARLYRTMEFIAQYRLRNGFGIESSNVDVARLPANLKYKYEKMKDVNGKIRIGLVKDHELLDEMGDELGKKYSTNNGLKDLLKRRNNSILAHGLDPVDEETFSKLYEITEKFAGLVVPDLEELMIKSKFPNFDDLFG